MTIASDIRIMGILNVTPDSFSDGGRYLGRKAAIDRAAELIEAGADIIDVGGESSRPYAQSVAYTEELARVIPVIEAIRTFSSVPVSIDTCKAEVARQALAAGATMVNDISALRGDPEMIEVLCASRCDIVIMHMQGTPGTMQDAPHYTDVIEEILFFFQQRLNYLTAAGVDPGRVVLDPGIGFGKTLQHNLCIVKNISRFSSLGRRVMLGHSRKRFLGEVTKLAAPDRDLISAVVSALCLTSDVSFFRVHDVAATKHALQVAQAIAQAC